MAAETNPSTPESSPPPRYSVEGFKALSRDSLEDQATALQVADRLPTFTAEQLEDPDVLHRIPILCDMATRNRSTADISAFMKGPGVEAGLFAYGADGQLGPVVTESHIAEKSFKILEVRLERRACDEIDQEFKATEASLKRGKDGPSPVRELAELTARKVVDRGIIVSRENLEALAKDNLPKGAEVSQAFLKQVTERITQIPAERAAVEQAQAGVRTRQAEAQVLAARQQVDQATAALGQQAKIEKRAAVDAVGKLIGVDLLDRDKAHAEALKDAATFDSEVAAAEKVRADYERRLSETTDPSIRLHLRNEQAGAIEAAAKHQREINGRAMATLSAVSAATREGRELDSPIRLDRSQPGYREQATAQREVLKLDPKPFLELKKGGLFHAKARRGPKVIERYYRSTDIPSLIVAERALRRNGELLSQTTFTTEQPLRHSTELGYSRYLPPQRFMEKMDAVRLQDQGQYRPLARDYVSSWDDPGWLQREHIAALGADDYLQHRRQKRRGGFFFYLFGGGR